ncbi:MAG: anthranilate phosphoribosyltransferase [Alphaproteobacteria bacterium]|nr:anthranilate phosphoribosyltransferase [Alphaproteobacteria bacterium]
MPLTAAVTKTEAKQDLTAEETRAAFDVLFSGEAPENQIAAFLLALHNKGETADEILGAVQSMRGKMEPIAAPANAIDIVGTGGDGRNTLNISTAAALVVAACGIPVAKHGNRAASSRSGSSDVLAALGLNLEPSFAVLERCLAEANLCFLFAPRHHPSMRHVADIRRKLGMRTTFNLLGPLTNPASVKRHLIGVYDAQWLRPMAETLRQLGSEAAWLTHGQDGMDELTTYAPSNVITLAGGKIGTKTVFAMEAGIATPAAGALEGGDAAFNAVSLKRLLAGEKGPYRDIVALNAAAALIVSEKADNLHDGVAMAGEVLDNGAAAATLAKLVKLTNA